MSIRALIATTLVSLPLLAGAVSAATVTGQNSSAGGGAVVTPGTGGDFSTNMTWARGSSDPTIANYVTFTSALPVEIFLGAYSAVSSEPVEISLIVQKTDATDTSIILDTFEVTGYARSPVCSGAALSVLDGPCTALELLMASGDAPGPTDSLFGELGAGSYRVGMMETGVVSAISVGSLTVNVAEVPVPATALLLVGAVGGLAGLRSRRRRSAD